MYKDKINLIGSHFILSQRNSSKVVMEYGYLKNSIYYYILNSHS